MADVKFSELSSLSTVASADVLAIVDSSESASKQLTIDNLFGAVPVNLAVTDITQSTSNTTGSITTTGGLGVSKDAYVGGALNVFGAVDIDGAVQIDGTVTVGVDDTGYDVKFFGDTSGNYWLWDTSADGTVQVGNSQLTGTLTVGVDDTGHDVKFFGATSGQYMLWDQSADELALVGDTKLSFHDAAGGENIIATSDGHLEINAGTTLDITAATVDINSATKFNVDGPTQLTGAVTVGVDDTGHDVTIYGATASSNLLWDESDNALEFGNSTITMSDARTSGTATITGLTIDISNKVDTGSSNDRIGIDCDVIGDVNGYTIRDAVAIRAVSRQSTGAEVTRLNTPIHAILDLANTGSANNAGTTLSGAYGLVIDHDDTVATRTGQPTAFISFGEMYAGGTETIETSCLFDIFPEGKNGDATFNTAANVAFYTDGAQYATTRDTMILNSTDGSPGTDEYGHILLEPDPFDAILLESGTESGGGGDDMGFINTESGESIVLEDASQDNPTGASNLILFESGSQDADGVLKIKVNGEYKYLQLYNSPGSGIATGATGGY